MKLYECSSTATPISWRSTADPHSDDRVHALDAKVSSMTTRDSVIRMDELPLEKLDARERERGRSADCSTSASTVTSG